MATYARLDVPPSDKAPAIVQEIAEVADHLVIGVDIYPPDLIFVPCGPEVGQRWTYDGSRFTAPAPFVPEPAVPVDPVAKLRDLLAEHPELLAALTKAA